ncbi:MAG: hypothetical protein FRX49_01650 [Trebouxia sp. A1-2]|nr:MAG: hypothetical protein FRX49_01650 [Trebouxia sp. A1-2]
MVAAKTWKLQAGQLLLGEGAFLKAEAFVEYVCTNDQGQHLELQRMGIEETRWGWGGAPSCGGPGLLKHSLTLIIFINASTLHGNDHVTAVTPFCGSAEPAPWAAAGELLACRGLEPGRLLLVVCQEADGHLALPVVVTASAESDQVVADQRPKLPAKPQKAVQHNKH